MTPKNIAAKPVDRTRVKRRAQKKKKIRKSQSSYAVFYDAAPEGGYVAFVPALPGCHSQGETLEEAERNIKEAIEAYLESLVAHHEPIPEEARVFQGIVTVSVPVRA
jgi:predicted RNase H-like HicB family nuclease